MRPTAMALIVKSRRRRSSASGPAHRGQRAGRVVGLAAGGGEVEGRGPPARTVGRAEALVLARVPPSRSRQLPRRRARVALHRQVEVHRTAAQQQVAHGAAHEVGGRQALERRQQPLHPGRRRTRSRSSARAAARHQSRPGSRPRACAPWPRARCAAVVEDRGAQHGVGAALAPRRPRGGRACPRRPRRSPARPRRPPPRGSARARSRPRCRRGPCSSAGSPPPRARRPRAPTPPRRGPSGVRPPFDVHLVRAVAPRAARRSPAPRTARRTPPPARPAAPGAPPRRSSPTPCPRRRRARPGRPPPSARRRRS